MVRLGQHLSPHNGPAVLTQLLGGVVIKELGLVLYSLAGLHLQLLHSLLFAKGLLRIVQAIPGVVEACIHT